MLRFVRGIVDSILEGLILQQFGVSNQSVVTALSAFDIFAQALSAGVSLRTFGAVNLEELAALALSAQAKARIAQAIGAGKLVVVPQTMVDVGGRATIAWLEAEPVSGNTIFVNEDGLHAGIAEFGTVEIVEGEEVVAAEVAEAHVAGFAGAQFVARLNFAAAVAAIEASQIPVVTPGLKLAIASITRVQLLPPGPLSGPFLLSYAAGVNEALELFVRLDPPAGDLLFTMEPSEAFGNLGSGRTSGVAADIIPDTLFTVPVGGAQLATVFRVGLKNLGAVADTFTLHVTDMPSGFTAQTSVPQLTIPAGETGEFAVCLRPSSGLPAPGNPAFLGIQAISTHDPAVLATATEPVMVPVVHAVLVTATPQTLHTAPGTPVTTTLAATVVGNTPESVTLSAVVPAGLTVEGFGPLTLGVGATATQTLTFLPSGDTPLNTIFTATIIATFGPTDTPQTQTTTVAVQVIAPGVESTANAAGTARQLGNTALAQTLNALSIALTNLVQTPTEPVFMGQVLAHLDSLQRQLPTDAFLSRLTPDLAAMRGVLAAATSPAEVQQAVRDLGTVLSTVDRALSGLAQHNFTLSLQPNTQVAQPQIAAPLQLFLHNTGTAATTYTFRLSTLPAGVTGVISPATLTLAPGQFSPALARQMSSLT